MTIFNVIQKCVNAVLTANFKDWKTRPPFDIDDSLSRSDFDLVHQKTKNPEAKTYLFQSSQKKKCETN